MRILMLVGAAIIPATIWMLSADERDRWVIRDGSVACSLERDLIAIQDMTSPLNKRDEIETLVKANKCVVLFANEKVRILELSLDGSRVNTRHKYPAGWRWMFVGDLKRTSPYWINWP